MLGNTLSRRARLLVAACAVAGTAVIATPPASGAPAATGPARIWALGDSITYGVAWRMPQSVPAAPPPAHQRLAALLDAGDARRVLSPGGYRAPLHLLLTASGFAHEYVGTDTDNPGPVLTAREQTRHDGHPSYRLDHVHNALTGRAVRPDTPGPYGIDNDNGGSWLGDPTVRPGAVEPDVVILHVGTNDIGVQYDPLSTYGRPDLRRPAHRPLFAANLATRLGALVDDIQALRPGVKIVLSTVLPIAESPVPAQYRGWDATVYHYNERIKALAAAEAGQGVVLADVWSPFAEYVPATAGQPETVVLAPGVMSPDTGHPLPATYQVMAAIYREALAPLLPVPLPL